MSVEEKKQRVVVTEKYTGCNVVYELHDPEIPINLDAYRRRTAVRTSFPLGRDIAVKNSSKVQPLSVIYNKHEYKFSFPDLYAVADEAIKRKQKEQLRVTCGEYYSKMDANPILEADGKRFQFYCRRDISHEDKEGNVYRWVIKHITFLAQRYDPATSVKLEPLYDKDTGRENTCFEMEPQLGVVGKKEKIAFMYEGNMYESKLPTIQRTDVNGLGFPISVFEFVSNVKHFEFRCVRTESALWPWEITHIIVR